MQWFLLQIDFNLDILWDWMRLKKANSFATLKYHKRDFVFFKESLLMSNLTIFKPFLLLPTQNKSHPRLWATGFFNKFLFNFHQYLTVLGWLMVFFCEVFLLFSG